MNRWRSPNTSRADVSFAVNRLCWYSGELRGVCIDSQLLFWPYLHISWQIAVGHKQKHMHCLHHQVLPTIDWNDPSNQWCDVLYKVSDSLYVPDLTGKHGTGLCRILVVCNPIRWFAGRASLLHLCQRMGLRSPLPCRNCGRPLMWRYQLKYQSSEP